MEKLIEKILVDKDARDDDTEKLAVEMADGGGPWNNK